MTGEIKRPSKSHANALKNTVEITESVWSKIENRENVRREERRS